MYCWYSYTLIYVAGSSSGGELAQVKVLEYATNSKWSRPVREEGVGGAWMMGRRVQIWCDKQSFWREGRVENVSAIDARMHSVLFVGASPPLTDSVNLSKVRW